MSSQLFFDCIKLKDEKRLKELLRSNALYISPTVVEAARSNPAIHEMITSNLKESTHLIRAAHSGLHECVKLSLRCGADPNMRNNKGQTALHLAASTGQPDIIRTLLEHCADANIIDRIGRIPLIFALQSECQESVDLISQATSTASLSRNRHLTMQLLTEEELLTQEEIGRVLRDIE
jgi:ankyrin repeat protein